MKLIDADKLELKHYVQGGNAIIGFAGTIPLYHFVDVIKEDINNAPIVEAIPIEWVNQFVINTCKSSHDDSFPAFLYWLDKMVAKWRKENESIK